MTPPINAANPSAAPVTPLPGWSHRLAGWLAESTLFAKGKRLFEANARDWNMPMTQTGKLWAGLYIILADYSVGLFPPTFSDQAKLYDAEARYMETMPGTTLEQNLDAHMRKPFWGSPTFGKYSQYFARLLAMFESLGLKPGSRLLELGCGSGWMTEFLAVAGYAVVGTTISPHDVRIGEKRIASLRAKDLPDALEFLVSPMESVDQAVAGRPPFDGVFVFEALHHAYDWRKTLEASYRVLRPGGWLVIASEPNVLQTFISYRFARINRTHEVGFRQRELLEGLRAAGFKTLQIRAPRWNNGVATHWIAAQR